MRRSPILALSAVLLAAGAAEAARVEVTLSFDPEVQAGADAEGRVLVFTPKPLAPGSSVSHFDTSARPNLLMEPSISSDLRAGRVDLTRPAMEDFGWPRGSFEPAINYTDGAGSGFNDPNLGDVRRAAFEFAVGRWARLLGSSVSVNIDAQFRDFECDETGGVLAAAGPDFAFMNFAGADPNIWYPSALADSISGQNLSLDDDSNPSASDLSIGFNTGIDEGCLGEGSSYYYGTDDNVPPGQISFVTVAMHEMAHGLGFTSLVDSRTGALFRGFPDSYSRLLFDNKVDKSWAEMNVNQRKKSAVRAQRVVLDGDRTTAAAGDLLSGTDTLVVHSPRNLARAYTIASAVFGPPLTEAGITGELAIGVDGSDQPGLGCEALVNPDEIAGKIALIDRGECFFVDKVKNAQAAGATAVIIVNNVGGPPPTLGGDDDGTIEIPAVSLGRKDGRKLKRRVNK